MSSIFYILDLSSSNILMPRGGHEPYLDCDLRFLHGFRKEYDFSLSSQDTRDRVGLHTIDACKLEKIEPNYTNRSDEQVNKQIHWIKQSKPCTV